MRNILKAHKQQKELLASAVFKAAAFGNQLFQKGPRQANNIVGGKFLQTKQQAKELELQLEYKHNGKDLNENNLFQGDTNSGSTRKVTIYSRAGKKIILVGSTSKCPDSRKTKTLCKKEAISNKGSEYFRNCEGISNSFSLNPCNNSCPGKFISI